MARDPRRLRVFSLADDLVPLVYRATLKLPAEERFGLVSQMRRAAVSIPSNIVEGCARRSSNDYQRFLTIANGSAYELGYLIQLSGRLRMLEEEDVRTLAAHCGHVAASLTALIDALEIADASIAAGGPTRTRARKPKA